MLLLLHITYPGKPGPYERVGGWKVEGWLFDTGSEYTLVTGSGVRMVGIQRRGVAYYMHVIRKSIFSLSRLLLLVGLDYSFLHDSDAGL